MIIQDMPLTKHIWVDGFEGNLNTGVIIYKDLSGFLIASTSVAWDRDTYFTLKETKATVIGKTVISVSQISDKSGEHLSLSLTRPNDQTILLDKDIVHNNRVFSTTLLGIHENKRYSSSAAVTVMTSIFNTIEINK